MKSIFLPLSLAVLALSLQPPSALAQGEMQNSTQNVPPPPLTGAGTIPQQRAWLGVMLRPVPNVLHAQLSQLIPAGQGVLVAQVNPQSPAAKAGIKKNDVLLTFGDQKLYSGAQLSALVTNSKPGESIAMQVVQQGKVNTLNVEIGAQPAQTTPRFWRGQPRMFPHPVPQGQGQQSLAWDSFESVQVKTLPDGRYHAEVSYKDPKGDTKSFTFEGKKEEIVKQIQQQKELPEDKRKALLDALNMKPGNLFGQTLNQPFFQGNPFNDPFFRDPFFQRNPFNDPFFGRMPQMPPSFPQFRQPNNRGKQPISPNASVL